MLSARTLFGSSMRWLAPLALAASCAVDWDGQVEEGVERERTKVERGRPELDGGADPAATDAGERSEGDASSPDERAEPAAKPAEVDMASRLLPPDALLWFSADHGLTVDSDGHVQAWEDRSGQGISAWAERAELAPVLRGDSALPLVTFDGAQELRLTDVPPLEVLTSFAVAEVTVEDRKCPSILHLSNSADGIVQMEDLEFGRHQRELYYECGSKSVPLGVMHTGSFSIGALHVLSVRHEPSTLAVTRVDGRDVHSRSIELPPAVARSYNFIGQNHYHSDGAPSCEGFLGSVAEIIVYARSLDDRECMQVERYLSEKWNVPLAASL